MLLQTQLDVEEEGLTGGDAIAVAFAILGKSMNGIGGADKKLIRARHAARERGFLNPIEPVLAMLTTVVEPEFKVARLRGRGRPRKK